MSLFQNEIPLDPDWELYLYFESEGTFRLMTARVNGRLVGYAGCLITPHIQHKSTVCADVNALWLDEDFHKGIVGVRMLRKFKEDLSSRGVKMLRVASKLAYKANKGGLGKLLEFLGFVPDEVVYIAYTGAKDEQR